MQTRLKSMQPSNTTPLHQSLPFRSLGRNKQLNPNKGDHRIAFWISSTQKAGSAPMMLRSTMRFKRFKGQKPNKKRGRLTPSQRLSSLKICVHFILRFLTLNGCFMKCQTLEKLLQSKLLSQNKVFVLKATC